MISRLFGWPARVLQRFRFRREVERVQSSLAEFSCEELALAIQARAHAASIVYVGLPGEPEAAYVHLNAATMWGLSCITELHTKAVFQMCETLHAQNEGKAE